MAGAAAMHFQHLSIPATQLEQRNNAMTLHFRCTALFVPDVPATVEFYLAFGLALRYMHPSSGYAELDTGETLLAFVGESFIETTSLLGGLSYVPSRTDAPPPAA